MSGDQIIFEDDAGIERLVGTLHMQPTANPGDVLTVQQDRSIAAAAGGGGGGGVQVVTVPLDSADILDIFNTPVILVAGTPGTMTVVVGVSLVYLAGVTPYTDHGGSLVVGDATGTTFDWADVTTAGFWDQATSQAFIPQPNTVFGALTAALAGVDGLDVVLQQSTANPTLGDGTLSVTVAYFSAPTT